MRSSIVLSMVASCNNFRYSTLRSATSFGRGRHIDQCFHKTHKKKLQGVTSGDLGYQGKRTRSSSVAKSVFESSRTQNAFFLVERKPLVDLGYFSYLSYMKI